MNHVLPAIEGFALGGGLIVAIGAQNAFILRHGLLRQHVFVLCLIASVSDAFLIALGVAGLGAFVEVNRHLLIPVLYAGVAFLVAYGLLALKRAIWPKVLDVNEQSAPSLGKAVTILLSFTFLNPHVYLDTVLLLGGLSTVYQGIERWSFALGAMTASFMWFFSLGYGARWLTPIFAKPVAWRILDLVVALIMFRIALGLFALLNA